MTRRDARRPTGAAPPRPVPPSPAPAAPARADPGYRGSGRPGEPVDRNPGAAGRVPSDRRREGLRLRLTGALYVAAWEAARRVPEPVAFTAADLLARGAHRLNARSRATVAANLARVVDPSRLDRTVRDAFRSYGRYWAEAFRAADVGPDDLDRRTTTAGFEHLDAALERGNGVVVLLAHHGSWDTAARWAETHGYHLAVVAEVLRPRAVFDKFVALREAVGLEVVPLRRGASSGARLAEVAAANHLVGLLADRDLTGKAPVVELFGEAARIPAGPAVLARRTGAAIVPITMLQRPGRRWHLQVLPAVDVDGVDLRTACRRLAGAIEDLVRVDPAQWHVFRPLWLSDLPERHGGSSAPQEPTV